jgi:hypothetical protein
MAVAVLAEAGAARWDKKPNQPRKEGTGQLSPDGGNAGGARLLGTMRHGLL